MYIFLDRPGEFAAGGNLLIMDAIFIQMLQYQKISLLRSRFDACEEKAELFQVSRVDCGIFIPQGQIEVNGFYCLGPQGIKLGCYMFCNIITELMDRYISNQSLGIGFDAICFDLTCYLFGAHSEFKQGILFIWV